MSYPSSPARQRQKFKYGANSKIIGKTDPQKLSYAGAFKPTTGTFSDLASHIGKGYPWMPAVLDEGKPRWQQHANYADLLGADIDSGITIEEALAHPLISQYCGLAIESSSSTPKTHKFRLVFALPYSLTDWQTIRVCNQYLIELLSTADKSCKDASRFFFGAAGRVPFLLNEDVLLPADFVEQALRWHQTQERQAEETYRQAIGRREKFASEGDWNRLELIRRALNYIPPRQPGTGNYDECITVLMALYHEFGETEAIILAEQWSPSLSGTTWDVTRKVKSFCRGTKRPVTIGSLMWIAKQNGFQFSAPKNSYTPTVNNSSADMVKSQTVKYSVTTQELQAKISELVSQNLLESDLTTTILDLAAQWNLQPKDIWTLYRACQQEQEYLDGRDDRANEIDQLLKIGRYQLRLSDYLHPILATPLEKIAEYMGTTAGAMMFTLLPAIASLCRVGTKLELIQPTSFYALPIVYTGLVAESGTGKSPAQKTILQALFRLQEQADLEYKQRHDDYTSKLVAWEKTKREDREDKPQEPVPREYYTVDVTREAMALIQSQQPESGFLGWIDELSAIITSRNQYRNGKGSDKESLLSGRDGSPIKVNRASGKRLSAPQSAYSITGGTQPDTLKKLMGDFSDGDGQWARFLWCILPVQPAPFPNDAITYDIEGLLYGLYTRVATLQPETYKLSTGASECYRNWYNQLDRLRLAEHKQALRSVYQKLKRDTGVLMLLLHLISGCIPDSILSPEVSEETAIAAIKLSKFCISQVELIHSWGDEANGEISPTMTRLIELSQRKGWITARDAKQSINALKGKQYSSNVIRQIFHDLCEMGYGTIEGSGPQMRWTAQDKLSVVGGQSPTVDGSLRMSSTVEALDERKVHQTVGGVENSENCTSTSGVTRKLKLDDLCTYQGQEPVFRKQYGGILKLYSITKDGACCTTEDGRASTWLPIRDLKLLPLEPVGQTTSR